MLFAISGCLYTLHDDRPYKERTKKHFRTLLVPYLVWSAAGFAFVYILEMFPATRQLVANSHLVQISETRLLLHDYFWYEALTRWIFVPVPYQLWFLRVLIIYNIAYPALRWCVMHKTAKWVFFIVAIHLWLDTFGTLLVEGEGLLFYSLGLWIQKTKLTLETPPRWLNPAAFRIVFVVACAVKTWLAFKGFMLWGGIIMPIMVLLHKLAVLAGL